MRSRERVVWGGSLVSGAMMGIAMGVWQMAIESAQVQAGLIAYPSTNSFYLYHIKMWSLPVQLSAILLSLGVGEPLANHVLNAVMGAICFSSLALLTFAFCRRTWLSLTVPFLVVGSGIYNVGTTYFIALLGSPHTFGVLGTTYALLVLALIGLGRGRLSWFTLGLAPAVHPSIGAWLWGVSAITLALDRGRFKDRWRMGGQYFNLGASLTLLSFCHHLYISRGISPLDPVEAQRYLAAFIESWDDHRSPVSFLSPGVIMGLLTVWMGYWWPRKFPKDFSESSKLTLQLLSVSAALALIASLLSHVQDYLPGMLRVAMPWRNLNVSSLAFAPVVFGLAALMESRRKRHLLVVPAGMTLQLPLILPSLMLAGLPAVQSAIKMLPAMMLLLLVFFRLRTEKELQRQRNSVRQSSWRSKPINSNPGIPVFGRGRLWQKEPLHQRLRSPEVLLMAALTVGAILCWILLENSNIELYFAHLGCFPSSLAAGCLVLASMSASALFFLLLPSHRLSELTSEILAYGTVGVAMLGPVVDATNAWRLLPERVKDWRSSPVLAAAHATRGNLLISVLHQIQLRAQRPLVLNPYYLNSLPYVLESGPDMERVLKDAFGISLFAPPGKRIGGLAPEDGRKVWETRTFEEWRDLAARYQIGAVMAPPSWQLQLKQQVHDDELALYAIEPARVQSPPAVPIESATLPDVDRPDVSPPASHDSAVGPKSP